MADLERTYNIPLRSEWLKVPRYKRAKKAIVGLKTFVMKHMKTKTVSVGKFANEAIWARGMKSPPHHLKVTILKKDDVAYVELFGKPIVTEKKVEKKSLAEKLGMKKKADVQEAEVVEEKEAKAEKNEVKAEAETTNADKEASDKKEAKSKKAKKAKEDKVVEAKAE